MTRPKRAPRGTAPQPSFKEGVTDDQDCSAETLANPVPFSYALRRSSGGGNVNPYLGWASFASSRQRSGYREQTTCVQRTSNQLLDYLTSHPDKGFACELLLLVPQERVENDGYNPLRFLSAGTMSGYRFEIGDCSTDAKGLTAHYQVSAVPAERGVSGLRAFCTDESGLIWYDEVTKADRQRTVWLHDAQWSD